MEYKTYLQTEHWKGIREEKLSRVNWCQVCGGKEKLHIHHKRYKYNPNEHLVLKGVREVGSILGKERTGNLLVLCASCHKLTHTYFDGKIDKKARVHIRRLMEAGVIKKKAFWIASSPELMLSVYNTITRKGQK